VSPRSYRSTANHEKKGGVVKPHPKQIDEVIKMFKVKKQWLADR
jgi:hypothetical protein